jgi:hypothetical protein
VSFRPSETHALVHFDDQLTQAVVLLKPPKIGTELEGLNMPEGCWIVDHMIVKTGEQDGLEYVYAVWAKRTE